MSYCQETNHHQYTQEKQKIDFILDDKRMLGESDPVIVNSSNTDGALASSRLSDYQFIHYNDNSHPSQQEHKRLPLPSTYNNNTHPVDNRPPPTATELQYIKRIHTLMTLVAKQTKEIQSLRSIIEAYSQNENNDCCSINNRKRNKQC
jgi:hypothetical protein